MNRVDVTSVVVDAKLLRKRNARAEDFDHIIDEPCEVFVDGEHALTLGHVVQPEPLIHALKEIEYRKDYRTSGMYTQSRVFGFRPREPLRKDFCAVTSMANESPVQHEALCCYAHVAELMLSAVCQDRHRRQLETVSVVSEAWRIGGGIFTSGIVNHDNPLAYHRDAGNFKDTWSAMFAMQRDINGGLFVIPEWRLALSFAKPSVVFFDGSRWLHGVTPIRRNTKASYRYTVVYYALKMMANCGTPDEEIKRIRKLKSEREKKRTR